MRVSYKKRILKNTGNYESLCLEIGAEDDLDIGEHFEDARLRLRTLVNGALKEELIKIGSK